MRHSRHIHHASHTFVLSYPLSLSHRLYTIVLGPLLIVALMYVIYSAYPVFAPHSSEVVSFSTMAQGALYTLGRITVAYIFSLIFAVPLALLAISNKTLEALLLPVFDVMESIPILAVFPLVIVVFLQFNFLNGAAIFILFLNMLWNIVFALVGGLKIDEWADACVDERIARGEPLTVLTQWCISRNLEARFASGGGGFVPVKGERDLFSRDMPRIIEAAEEAGIRLSWLLTLNRPYLDSWLAERDTELKYEAMLQKLAEPLVDSGHLLVLNWEEEVLGGRPRPDPAVLANPENFVSPKMIEQRLAWLKERARFEPWTVENGPEEDLRFKIACEAEEGRLLTAPGSPVGDFILMPLETAEQYDFFVLLAPDFKKRLAMALPLYPWRS